LVTVRVRGVAFAAVTALKDTEVIQVHVLVRIKPRISTGRIRLGNCGAQSAHPEVTEIRGINVAVVVEITGNDSRARLLRERASQQEDRESQRVEIASSVHVEISV
jgi:hypothetical protein